jgi:hypothetical protein
VVVIQRGSTTFKRFDLKIERTANIESYWIRPSLVRFWSKTETYEPRKIRGHAKYHKYYINWVNKCKFHDLCLCWDNTNNSYNYTYPTVPTQKTVGAPEVLVYRQLLM